MDLTTPSTEVPAQDVEPNVPTSGSAPIPEQEVQDQQEDQEDVDEVPLAEILQGMKKGRQPQQNFEEEDSVESEGDRKSTRLNSSHICSSRMPSSA